MDLAAFSAWVDCRSGKLGGMEFDFSLSDPHNFRLGRCRVSRSHSRLVCFCTPNDPPHVAGSDRARQKKESENSAQVAKPAAFNQPAETLAMAG